MAPRMQRWRQGATTSEEQPAEDMPLWVLIVAIAWTVALVALFFVWITTPSFREELPKLYGHSPGIPVEVPFFGALGGLVASLGGIFFYNRGTWRSSYNYWHAFKPVIGAITGSVSCLLLVVILRAASSNGKITADATTFDAAAFVFGYAESAFRELIKAVTDIFLKPEGKEGAPATDAAKGATAGAAAIGQCEGRPQRLNVTLGPDMDAHRAFRPPRPRVTKMRPQAKLADGFTPQPHWNLREEGGRTIVDLAFVNCYVGPANAWDPGDRQKIDLALESAMTDNNLQGVIAQYYAGPITSTMLPSRIHTIALGATVYKDAAERLAKRLHGEGVLGEADPQNSVINIMLPRGIVLSSERSTGAPAEAHLEVETAVESTEGLGGYHGSLQLEDGTVIYYAVGVYSEPGNGIPAFDEPWKNVVATFYHELNEARTDPDVEEANDRNADALLGWYSHAGQGEIGDLPINAANGDLSLVFQEVPLAAGVGTVPIQLMWSNEADGPAVRVGP
jgi:hypothetical protein